MEAKLKELYKEIEEKANQADNHYDTASAAAFWWVVDAMERRFPFLEK